MRLGDRFRFDATAADGAEVEPRGGDEHFAPDVGGRTPDDVDQRHAGKGSAAGGEFGEPFDVTLRGWHLRMCDIVEVGAGQLLDSIWGEERFPVCVLSSGDR